MTNLWPRSRHSVKFFATTAAKLAELEESINAWLAEQPDNITIGGCDFSTSPIEGSNGKTQVVVMFQIIAHAPPPPAPPWEGETA